MYSLYQKKKKAIQYSQLLNSLILMTMDIKAHNICLIEQKRIYLSKDYILGPHYRVLLYM